ncbi:MAG: calpain family cysteine protease [archaeon]|nr:calpain family cysteine protease [archaeon]
MARSQMQQPSDNPYEKPDAQGKISQSQNPAASDNIPQGDQRKKRKADDVNQPKSDVPKKRKADEQGGKEAKPKPKPKPKKKEEEPVKEEPKSNYINYQGLNKGVSLDSLQDSGKRLIAVNEDTSFLPYSEYFHKQVPPEGNVQNWTDPEFPPNHDSMLFLKPNNDVMDEEKEDLEALTWDRAENILKTKNFTLYDTIEMNDISQGLLGDCYFLSVISVLANRPELYDKIFISKKKEDSHCYKIRFYIRGIPKIVCVDDYFPVDGKQFAFAMSGKNEIWVQVLEKAWAKVNGSYAMSIAGLPSETFLALNEASGVTYVHDKYTPDKLWNFLKEGKKAGYDLATSCNVQEAADELGLVEGHAYSFTGVYEVPKDDGTPLRLVQLRNPWGNFEYTGNFSSDSPSWNIIPGLKKKVGFNDKDDGVFFMSFEDFLKYFNYSFALKYRPGWYYNFKKLQQQSTDHFAVAKFELKEKAQVDIGVHLKQQRFYDKVENYEVPPARIILGLYNPDKKSYTFAGSNFEQLECFYCETSKILKPGIYHIFINSNWPYDTPNHLTLTTYSSIPIEIEELKNKEIPNDYIEQIFCQFPDKMKIEMKSLNNDIVLQLSNKDNNLGYYLAVFGNKSKTQPYKIQVDCTYKNLSFLQENMVKERKQSGASTKDIVETFIKPRERICLVWKLNKEEWNCKFTAFKTQVSKSDNAGEEELTEEEQMNKINDAYKDINKVRLEGTNIEYAEFEDGKHFFVMLRNLDKKTINFLGRFVDVEGLTPEDQSWLSGKQLELVFEQLLMIKFKVNSPKGKINYKLEYQTQKQ